MNESVKEKYIEDCLKEGPHSAMERMLLEEYLHQNGCSLSDIDALPEEQAKSLMVEACKYASLKLAQVESTAHFREKIRGPS
jgi:hypothetical protein